MKILAESYAIKGLCLENIGQQKSGSKFKQAEREAEMVCNTFRNITADSSNSNKSSSYQDNVF